MTGGETGNRVARIKRVGFKKRLFFVEIAGVIFQTPAMGTVGKEFPPGFSGAAAFAVKIFAAGVNVDDLLTVSISDGIAIIRRNLFPEHTAKSMKLETRKFM